MISIMQSNRTWLYLSLSILLLISFAASVPARAQSSVILTAEAGFDAHYLQNNWVPVRLTIENNGENITGWIEIVTSGDNGAETTYTYAVSLPSAARKQLTMNVFLSINTRELQIKFYSAEQVVASTSVRLNQMYATDRLYGILSDHPSPYSLLANLDPLYGSAIVVPLEISDLPENPASWGSLHILIISDVDTGLLTSAQRAALEQWLASGGRVLIVSGAQWQKTSAGLTNLVPSTPVRSNALSNLDSLVEFSQSAVPLHITSPVPVTEVGISYHQSHILVQQDGIPLLVEQSYGNGQVYLLTADPALEPLRSWDGMLDLYQSIFSPQEKLPAWSGGVINWDAARQAASTLPNLAIPTSLSIACFLGAYGLVLGPLNYLVLRRVKKPEWGWITIPGVVILFSLGAILFGSLSRGSRPVLNRLAIIQAWPAIGQAAVSGVVGIYSPRPASVDVSIAGGSLVHPIPSGSDLASQAASLQIDAAGNMLIPDLRLSAGETIPLVFTNSLPSPAVTSDLTLDINSSGVLLNGSLTNHSQLTFSDAALLYPGGSLAIGEFAPGQSQTVSVHLTRSQYLDPAAVPSPYSNSGSYYPYSGVYFGMQDQTISDIIGSDDYYSDRTDYHRYLLLSTHISNQRFPGRGSGIYLTAWTDSFPAEIALADRPARLEDTSLYIFSLLPVLHNSEGMWSLTPGLFTFSAPAGSASADISPYDIYLYGEQDYDWEFSLAYPLDYSTIHKLEINLASTQSSLFPAELDVYLWDDQQSRWVQQDIGAWGAYSVPEPARYVSPGNEINLRLHYNGANSFYLDTADVTLQVIP